MVIKLIGKMVNLTKAGAGVLGEDINSCFQVEGLPERGTPDLSSPLPQ